MDEEENMLFAVAFATVLMKLRYAAANHNSLTISDSECSTLIEAFRTLQKGPEGA